MIHHILTALAQMHQMYQGIGTADQPEENNVYLTDMFHNDSVRTIDAKMLLTVAHPLEICFYSREINIRLLAYDYEYEQW